MNFIDGAVDGGLVFAALVDYALVADSAVVHHFRCVWAAELDSAGSALVLSGARLAVLGCEVL